MSKRWLDPTPVKPSKTLKTLVGGHPLVAETLARRGITTKEAVQRFLNYEDYQPASPFELPGMAGAVERVQRAIDEKAHICIWGDFDVDGQTATALLYQALRDLGATVSYHIPNRFSEGHGIALHTLQQILHERAVDVLLTCDTGIAAHEAVDFAGECGVDVVITDHHSLPETLPNAHAIINPQLLPEGHALRELPGVGTAYMLVKALYGDKSTDHLLDLVALGIVADVMVQVDDTRYWLQRGLEILRNTQRLSLQAMMELADIVPGDVNESDIGFTIAPRLNAMGRLEDANPAVELLTTDDLSRARVMVNELEQLNSRRRFLSQQVYEGAQAEIVRDPSLLEYAALVLAYPDWHTGVVGIVANRLVEEYNRPVVLIAIDEEEGVARGSARSIAGCNITQAIAAQRDLLLGYGGHNMAAGLSLSADNIYDFRRGLSVTVREMLGDVDITPTLNIDGYLNLNELSLELVADLNRLAPFGNGNPPLTLATQNLHIKKKRNLGRSGDHLELTVEDAAGETQRVIYWRGGDAELPPGLFDLAYTLRANTYQGKTDVMVEWLDARPVESDVIDIETEPSTVIVIDARGADQPEQVLAEYSGALVWRETADIDGVTRYQLRPKETLIVWTIPPGVNEWLDALTQVKPKTLVLVGENPGVDKLEPFLKRLAGLVKFAVNRKDGFATLAELSAVMAHREQTVLVGLEWLAARGQIGMYTTPDGRLRFDLEGQATGNGETERLKALLSETRAYRRFWLRQDHSGISFE